MTEDGTNEAEGISAIEVDDEDEDADNQSEISRVSSASSRHSTSERSQYVSSLQLHD